MKMQFDMKKVIDFGNRLSDVVRFEQMAQEATRQIAKTLHKMLLNNTPVKSGELKKGWNTSENLAFVAKRVKKGFEVTLTNDVEYALSVNDGHYSYNQYNVGGQPYIVRNRTVPYKQGNKAPTFVYGRFFVEDSILDAEEKLDAVVGKELDKWFRWCVNGK